jgi:uncharacterized protein YqgC (DUF456 family)
LIPAFFLLGFAQSKTILWIGLILFSIGKILEKKIFSFFLNENYLASSLVINVINSFASKYGLESEKGTILGIFRSLQALARAIGPLLASFGTNLLLIFMFFYNSFLFMYSILVSW